MSAVAGNSYRHNFRKLVIRIIEMSAVAGGR